MNWKAYVTCNFNCHIETEEHLKVADSDLYCESGDISETVQDRDIVITDY